MKKAEEQYVKSLYMQIREAEQQMRDKPMPKLAREDFFLFHETGNRLVYENAYFGRRKYLTVYAILALWSGELSKKRIIDEQVDASAVEAYIKRLGDILISVCCEEPFWALPAHVDFAKIDQPETALTIDLFAAETAQALSEITLRLYDKLPCETVACVAREVTRRVLQPFASSQVPYNWETDRCNWSAVCAGSVGMTAIHIDALNRRMMADYMPDKQDGDGLAALDIWLYRDCHRQLPANWKAVCLKRVCDALRCYLDGMEDDGACTEGLGYYNYGMSFYAAFAEAYDLDDSRAQETEPLMYQEKCEQIALFQQKCYFTSQSGKGISISFSDGSRHESFLPGLTAYLKHCYPQVQTPDYTLTRPFDEDACYRYLTNERNISWLIQYADSSKGTDINLDVGRDALQCVDKRTTYLLPSAQWLICQDNNGNGFAAKGGNNNENHNHNDIGHFLCVYNGEMLLTDLGAGEYTKDYFSDKRYDILCNRSFGHSVPIINGTEQCAGEEYHADRFDWNEKENALTISFAGAYAKGCLEKLERRIELCGQALDETVQQKKMQIQLQDTFVTNESTTSIAENIVTEYKPMVHNGVVWVKGQHGQCSIQAENCSDSMIKIISCEHSDHAGKCQTVYRIVWNFSVKKSACVRCKMWITFYDMDVNR